jgi:hypothetical protein
MADEFTEVTTESGFARIGQSIKGVLGGLAMCAIAPMMLWWNEGRAVDAATGLAEGERKCISVPADKGQGAELVLAHVQGKATSDEELADPVFPVKAKALLLNRKVEMYQWKEEEKSEKKDKLGGGSETTTTYKYHKDWFARPIDSEKFRIKKDHHNPPMAYESLEVVSKNAKLGKFEFNEGQIRSMGGHSPLTITEEVAKSLPAEAADYTVKDGKLVNGDVQKPKVGDMRISFQSVQPQDVTVVAGAQNDKFSKWLAPNKYEINLLELGTHDIKTMFAKAQSTEAMITWILRFVGFILLWIGISMIFGPIVAIARIIPLFGSLVGTGVGMFAFVGAACISLGVIAIAWFAHRPILSLLLIGGAVGILFLAKSRSSGKPATAA